MLVRRVPIAFTAAVGCFLTAIAGRPATAQSSAARAGSIESGAPSAQMPAQQLEAIFMSACFGGAVKLDPGQESAIALGDLPSNLRRRFGKPLSANLWRLNSSTPSYLYVITFRPEKTTSPKVCGLATQSIEIGPAIEFLGSQLNGPSLDSFHEGFTGAGWLDAKMGFVAVASKSDNFTVMEVKQLTSEQQQRALRVVERMGTPSAGP
jgi:hypothetical protein